MYMLVGAEFGFGLTGKLGCAWMVWWCMVLLSKFGCAWVVGGVWLMQGLVVNFLGLIQPPRFSALISIP